MQVKWTSFDPERFSFRDDPVLILEDFWSPQERATFLRGMQEAEWRSLAQMPSVRDDFPGSGNWAKASMQGPEANRLLSRLQLTCIAVYVESFSPIGRHLSFHYYAYASGDCLPTHDDTVQKGGAQPARRLALATYLHDEWQPDWGGELIIYDKTDARSPLQVSHCITPQPGLLVLFTVPRFHRIARIDPLSKSHRRLSIAGWFMTSHAEARIPHPAWQRRTVSEPAPLPASGRLAYEAD